MLKSILEINGVKSLTRNSLKTISGGGTDCSVIFNACDEQHPTNDDKFEACLNYSGCGPAFITHAFN
ncbi:hypothetical protein [Aquimarina sp. 2201CG5-10]|uniref:hypothetical protein n=1 Tax=Aquimarina callyspongiae TaxID=3098150 RepID=UPI002AB3904E|nr:hypothetical protein [Aquimarina sp. 2201CG5-10]MDY8136460.1 hypothetical protein [Aquimarina sp. 2201CG5-10]